VEHVTVRREKGMIQWAVLGYMWAWS